MARLHPRGFTGGRTEHQHKSTNTEVNALTGNGNEKTTLVLGGTGKTGRRVVERLTALGVPVRAGSRSGDPRFDWEDPGTWAAAPRDVGSVYITYAPDLALPEAAATVGAFAKQAVAAEDVALLTLVFGEVLDGRNAHLGDGVQRALGRQPRDFSDYARDAAATGVWNV